MVLLISYDLNNYERPVAYNEVKAMIENNATSFKKLLYSQWLVETDKTPASWSNLMKGITDRDDSWFIVQVQRPYQGWLTKTIWSWLDEKV